jgi:transposase
MAKPLLPDDLWAEIEPLLPPAKTRHFHFPGRKPLDRRKVLTGIIFVLKTGVAWDDLSPELGLGCGRTCRNYLKKLQQLGIWAQLHQKLLSRLNHLGRIHWDLGIIDGTLIKAPLGGEKTGPNPTDRRKIGSKHHVLTDDQGIPISVGLSAANVPDIKGLIPTIAAQPAVSGKSGPPRRKFDRIMGDKGYDSDPHRQFLRALGITPIFPHRNSDDGVGMGVVRWVIERTNAWLHNFGRVRRRLDKLPAMQMAFIHLACAIICNRFIT